jgi:hypothetical protein
VTYEEVHAGDHVLGHDGDIWGVAEIEHVPRIAVTLVKPGCRVTGYPPAGTPVTIVARSDVTAEHAAAGVLIAAGFNIDIISEQWTP